MVAESHLTLGDADAMPLFNEFEERRAEKQLERLAPYWREHLADGRVIDNIFDKLDALKCRPCLAAESCMAPARRNGLQYCQSHMKSLRRMHV